MSTDSDSRCTCHNTLVVKNLNRWFKEKWVDVSRKDKDGKHPPCGRGKAKIVWKRIPEVQAIGESSGETPKTSGSMSSGQKRAATKRKRARNRGLVGSRRLLRRRGRLSDPAYWRRFENPGPLVTPRIPEKKKVKRTFNDSGLSEEDKAKYALERREDEAKRSEEKARVLQENQESRQRYQDRISEMQRSYQEEQRRKQAEEQRMKEAQAVGEVGPDDPESMYENLDWDRMQTGEPMDIAFPVAQERTSHQRHVAINWSMIRNTSRVRSESSIVRNSIKSDAAGVSMVQIITRMSAIRKVGGLTFRGGSTRTGLGISRTEEH